MPVNQHLPSFHFELNSSPRSLPRSPSFSISIRTSTRPTPTTLDQKPHAIPDTPHSLVRNPSLALGQRLSFFPFRFKFQLLCRLPRPSILATTPADHSLNLQLDSIPAPGRTAPRSTALSQTILHSAHSLQRQRVARIPTPLSLRTGFQFLLDYQPSAYLASTCPAIDIIYLPVLLLLRARHPAGIASPHLPRTAGYPLPHIFRISVCAPKA